MSSILLSTTYLLGFSLLLYKLFRGRVDYVLCLSTTPLAISIVLYCCVLFGILVPSTIVLSIAAIVGGLWCVIWLIIKTDQRSVFLQQLFSPAVVLPILFIVYLGYIFRSASLNNWDEFSHWGISVKYLLNTGHLPLSNHDTCCSDYPPFQPLFIYFFNRWGNSSESGFFLGKIVLLFLPLAVFLKQLTWRQCLTAVFLFITCIFALLFPDDRFAILTADNTLALYAAIPVVLLILNDENYLYRYFAALFIFSVPLIKPVGTAMAGIAALIISLQILSGWIAKTKTVRSRIADLSYLASLFLIILISRLSWKFYLQKYGIKEHFGFGINIRMIINAFSDAASPRHLQVIYSLKAYLSNDSFIQVCLALSSSILILCVAGIILSWWFPELRRQLLTSCVALVAAILGFSLWLLVHLIAYLFKFSDYEAVRLASISRYMGIYLSFVTLLCPALIVVLLAYFAPKRHPASYIVLPLTFLMCFWLQIPVIKWATGTVLTNDSITSLWRDYKTYINQKGYLSHANQSGNVRYQPGNRLRFDSVRKHLGPEAKVWVIFQGSDGLDYWFWRYELAGIGCNLWFWSLGSKPYREGDIWTHNWTPERWVNELQEGQYTHVVLGHIDQIFRNEYSSLFQEGEQFRSALYIIHKEAGNRTLLIPVNDSGQPVN